jgi:hypothetical protein
MAGDGAPWAPPLVEMTGGIVGHLLAWERHERDGSWWAWVSWVQESGGRRLHKVVQVRAGSLRPLEPPEAYKDVPRRVYGREGPQAPQLADDPVSYWRCTAWRLAACFAARGGLGRHRAGVDGTDGSAGFGGELALAALGGGCATPPGAGLGLDWLIGAQGSPGVVPGHGRLPCSNGRVGAGELAAELRHRNPDLVKRSRSHDGQGRILIGPANLDATFVAGCRPRGGLGSCRQAVYCSGESLRGGYLGEGDVCRNLLGSCASAGRAQASANQIQPLVGKVQVVGSGAHVRRRQ